MSRRALRVWLLALVALAFWGVPQLGEACAVCFSGRDESRAAFAATFVFMTALPLVMVGSVVWWLRRRLLELSRRGDPAESGSRLLHRARSSSEAS